MDGVREASAHTIVFQSRAGTPELNCCSVNAPRVLGALGDWAVMSAPDAVVLNWLAPLTVHTHAPDHSSLRLEIGPGPDDLTTRVRVFPQTPGTEFTLRVRVPTWTDSPPDRRHRRGPHHHR